MRRPHLPRRLARLRLPPPRRKSPVFEIGLLIGLLWYAVTLGLTDYDIAQSPAWSAINRVFTQGQIALIALALALAIFNTRYHRPLWWYLTVRVLTVGAIGTLAGSFLLSDGNIPGVGAYVGGAVVLSLTIGGMREW